MDNRITGKTGLMGLIGSPVGHSGSPVMYNYSFQKLGLDYAYLAFDVGVEGMKDAMTAMRVLNMRGMNVTMPGKTEVVKYMDELSQAARIIGAVNTIVNDNGKLTGYITDGEGFIRNLTEHGVSVKGKKITLLGAGGAATAIYVQAALDGASEIAIFNIKDAFFERAQNTSRQVMEEVPGCKIMVYDMENQAEMAKQIGGSEILINGTMVGMKPNEDASPIQDCSMLRSGLVVADVVYNPKETRLLKDAKAVGATCIGGSGMLLWQGAAAFKLYTGLEMPADEVNERFFS